MIHMSGTFKFEILQVKSPLAQVVKAKSPDHLYPTWAPIAIKLHCVKTPGLPNLRIILYFYWFTTIYSKEKRIIELVVTIW